ncbi:hypothetical protein MT414_14130 [Mammaliicoccus sciuri]|uniref:hypothetical protein n=1 Tax=Mammaliicoccus sciuri TaxID=1296 RepID=UPI001FB50E82|nr:hypothetical protein [Mammaliicoccus sciuri]MCJ1763153.1 hypothetical protein [Mammaliicoccus sciuri]WQJ50689.1 hypothetical protein P3U25_05485 [Mammaliicoccus sciuri]
MPTIKYTKEDIAKLVDELDQYKKAHDKLTAGLKEAVAESIKYKRERDSLIKDVEKLREELRMHIQCNDELGRVNKLKDKTISELRVISNNYTNLTEHIKDKALTNPSEHRYFRLVHFIDDLEDD